jgi:hypothetical protein
MLARVGDVAPGGGQWSAFDSLVLPDGPNSGPIFTASVKVPGKRRATRTLFGMDSEGQLHLLLGPGQSLTVNGGTREIASLRALEPARGSTGAARGFTDDGHVTALVTFTDQTKALVHIWIP